MRRRKWDDNRVRPARPAPGSPNQPPGPHRRGALSRVMRGTPRARPRGQARCGPACAGPKPYATTRERPDGPAPPLERPARGAQVEKRARQEAAAERARAAADEAAAQLQRFRAAERARLAALAAGAPWPDAAAGADGGGSSASPCRRPDGASDAECDEASLSRQVRRAPRATHAVSGRAARRLAWRWEHTRSLVGHGTVHALRATSFSAWRGVRAARQPARLAGRARTRRRRRTPPAATSRAARAGASASAARSPRATCAARSARGRCSRATRPRRATSSARRPRGARPGARGARACVGGRPCAGCTRCLHTAGHEAALLATHAGCKYE